MLREARYIMFGPGVSTIANAAAVIPRAACMETGNAVSRDIMPKP
jgi:hypothetical protein